MRKIRVITTFLVVLMLLGSVGYIFAAGNAPAVNITYTDKGTIVEASIKLANMSSIAGLELIFNYDSTKYTFNKAVLGSAKSKTLALANETDYFNSSVAGAVKCVVVCSEQAFKGNNWYVSDDEIFVVTLTKKTSAVVSNTDFSLGNILIGDSAAASVPNNPQDNIVVPGINVIAGDADNDGKVTIFDALCIRKFLANPATVINLVACDVSGNGGVDIFDALYISKYLAGLITELVVKP